LRITQEVTQNSLNIQNNNTFQNSSDQNQIPNYEKIQVNLLKKEKKKILVKNPQIQHLTNENLNQQTKPKSNLKANIERRY